MTNRELKEFLCSLTDEQLDQKVLLQSETEAYSDIIPDITDENYINPSGEGAEPISSFTSDPDDPNYVDVEGELIVLYKGQIMYYLS